MARIGEFVVHHWVLAVALLVILMLLAITEMKRKIHGFKDIPTDEAVRMMNRQNAVILDVREDKEYDQGHIINAVHIPLGLMDARIKQLDKHKDRPIIVCCKQGQDSAQAGMILRKHGFNPVYKLGGGISAWKTANLPLEK